MLDEIKLRVDLCIQVVVSRCNNGDKSALNEFKKCKLRKDWNDE
jgi:hypothetical protein